MEIGQSITRFPLTQLPVPDYPMPFSYDDFDLSDVKTYPLKSRASKARVEDFARPVTHGRRCQLRSLASLPNILAAADFKAVVRAIVAARTRRRRRRLGTWRARRSRPDSVRC